MMTVWLCMLDMWFMGKETIDCTTHPATLFYLYAHLLINFYCGFRDDNIRINEILNLKWRLIIRYRDWLLCVHCS